MPPSRALGRYLSLALLAVPAARAQEAGETIEVAGERPKGSTRAPGAAGTVIDLAQFGGEVRSVAELLQTAPGVSVHSLGGPGQAATLSLRGASADESLVFRSDTSSLWEELVKQLGEAEHAAVTGDSVRSF